LAERDAILKSRGYQVISVLSGDDAYKINVSDSGIGVVVIGHGAPRAAREQLISYFRNKLPGVPIVVLLRSTDGPFADADFNCPADDPPLWERTVTEILTRMHDA
jgi:DNA-binding NarL/FixJ family response regulator